MGLKKAGDGSLKGADISCRSLFLLIRGAGLPLECEDVEDILGWVSRQSGRHECG